MSRKRALAGVRLRLVLEPDIAIGPGKADLLKAIADVGSITAAARRLGMSYRRAWLLVDRMNRAFDTPLVETAKGGSGGGGGARLTVLGREVLARYRHMQRCAAVAVATDLAALRRRAKHRHRRAAGRRALAPARP